MILPILAYGDPILKKECDEIGQDYPKLNELISDMFETMYKAKGVGLAAPQIGKNIRLFIVDGSPFAEKEEGEEDDPLAEGIENFKKVFVQRKVQAYFPATNHIQNRCNTLPSELKKGIINGRNNRRNSF